MAKSSEKTETRGEARFAYEGLDRVIHERARLGVLTSLLSSPAGVSFVDLKQMCALTDGNLARHLQVLEAEGMVRLSKGAPAKAGRAQESGRVQTVVRITAAGRRRYLDYLTTLEQVVRDAAKVAEAAEADAAPRRGGTLKLQPARA